MALRNIAPLLWIGVAVTLLAGLAWLTRHPDSEIVRRAEEWPVVGPVAAWFRELYQPPPPAGATGDDVEFARPPALPARPPPRPPPGGPIWILDGKMLRRAASPGAEAILRFTAITRAVRLERRGDWFRVRAHGAEGWVYLEGYDEEAEVPYGNAAEPPRPLAPRPPEARKLATARELLGEHEHTLSLGPYTLYTDCRDEALLAHLSGLAEQLDGVYTARTGRAPLGTPRSAVVLYRAEADYRRLQQLTERIAGLAAAGHNSHGVAALYVEGRAPIDVAATLVHELTHLINRRALGPMLPPWLDEGLADDLAAAKVGAAGALLPAELSGEHRRGPGTVRVDGGLAALWQLNDARATGRLPSVERLVQLDWQAFVRPENARLHYTASAFWIRFLLRREDDNAAALRRFLAAVAEGEPPSGEALRAQLGEDWHTLDQAFRAWVLAEAARAKIPAMKGKAWR